MYVINDFEKEYTKNVFESREMERHHHDYEEERSFFEYIKRGDLQAINMAAGVLSGENQGKLSDNPLRHYRYMFVASMTLVTRFMMEGGMLDVEAYAISDSYIQQMDRLETEKDINELFIKMTGHVVYRMRSIVKTQYFSKAVWDCMNYIHEHLHERIDVPILGQHVGLTPTYLSAIFKKESGIGIAEYIRKERIDAAKNLLRFSDYGYGEIGTYLAFSSHSHFISLFKKETGMTPKEYRTKYYRKNWGQSV